MLGTTPPSFFSALPPLLPRIADPGLSGEDRPEPVARHCEVSAPEEDNAGNLTPLEFGRLSRALANHAHPLSWPSHNTNPTPISVSVVAPLCSPSETKSERLFICGRRQQRHFVGIVRKF